MRCSICDRCEGIHHGTTVVAIGDEPPTCLQCIESIADSLSEFEVPDEIDFWLTSPESSSEAPPEASKEGGTKGTWEDIDGPVASNTGDLEALPW